MSHTRLTPVTQAEQTQTHCVKEGVMLFSLSWRYLKKHIWALLAVLILQLAATIAALQLPTLNARIIDEGVATGNTAIIWTLGVEMLVIAASQMLCTALAIYLGARLAMSTGAQLRTQIFQHIHTFAAQDIHTYGTGSLITRSTNDVQQVQQSLTLFLNLMIGAPIMGIGGVLMAVRQDLHLGLILALLVPALALLVAFVMKHLSPLFQLQQERIDTMNTVLREELTGIRVIRAFIRQAFIRTRYIHANTELRTTAMSIATWFSFFFPAVTLVVSLGIVGVIWYGGILINSGTLKVGVMIAYITYVTMISMSVIMAGMLFVTIPRANVAATRVAHVLDHAPSVSNPNDTTALPLGRWTFAAEDASVRYHGAEEPVLDDISFTLRPGTTTAIIGATASGKTTLVNLLPRMMDPSSGRLTASGVPLTELPISEIRKRIALVPQQAYLFSGTIASSVSGIRTPTPAQRERIIWALKGAQAEEFVNSLDEGIDHVVEAGGTNFSGGQRQRLTIARALYRAADLYIFDDSFSALDYATEAQLRLALPEYTQGAAVLIVAQRVASIRHADEILVLDSGRIVGRGTHRDLMDTCPTYKEIVDSQLFEEDAA